MPLKISSSNETLPSQPNVAWIPPRARVYDGSALRNSNISFVQGSNLRDLETAQQGFSAAPAYSYPSALTANNLLVSFVIWDSTATISAAPSGWTAIAAVSTVTANGKTVSIRGYQKVAGSGESQTGSWTLTAAANWIVLYAEISGCATVSVQDKTNGGTGTSSAFTTGLTGTLSQASEVVIGLAVGSGAHIAGITGYTSVCYDQLTGLYAAMYQKTVNATTTTSMTGTADGTNPWAALIVTFKAAASSVKFQPLGEWDAYELTATMRAYDLGTFELRVSGNSPASDYARVGNIIHVTQRSDTANNSFGWYLIQTVDRDETQPETKITMQGADLRVLIGNRSFKQTVLEAQRGTLANYAVENWVRKYITVACISPSGNDYAATDVVPTLALEASSGNRGTVYTTDPPGGGGGTLLDIVSSLYRVDHLAWRVDVVDAGTTSGKLEFKTIPDSNRTIGQANNVVFAVQWDTAETLTVTEDTIGALTAATVKGPPSDSAPSNRTTYYVEDATTKSRYGLIYGEIDAANEPYLNATIAAKYLAERLPRITAKIKPRQTPLQAMFDRYYLNCKVTVLDRAGNQYDDWITSWTVSTSGQDAGFEDPFKGTPDIVHKKIYNPDPQMFVVVDLTVGYDPFALRDDMSRTNEPSELKEYTLLDAYTGSATTLNYLAGVTPGTTVANKALLVDASKVTDVLTVTTLKAGAGSNGAIADGATRNAQQSAAADLPTDGSATSVDIATKVNDILSRLRSSNIIAT